MTLLSFVERQDDAIKNNCDSVVYDTFTEKNWTEFRIAFFLDKSKGRYCISGRNDGCKQKYVVDGEQNWRLDAFGSIWYAEQAVLVCEVGENSHKQEVQYCADTTKTDDIYDVLEESSALKVVTSGKNDWRQNYREKEFAVEVSVLHNVWLLKMKHHGRKRRL